MNNDEMNNEDVQDNIDTDSSFEEHIENLCSFADILEYVAICNFDNGTLNEDEIPTIIEKFKVYYEANQRHFYHEIASFVFDNAEIEDKLEFFPEKLSIIIESIDGDESLKGSLKKLYDHFELEQLRYGKMKQNIENLCNENIARIEYMSNELELKMQQLNVEIKADIDKKVDSNVGSMKRLVQRMTKNTKADIDNKVTGIYTQVVTILGIFTAIVFSMFGGLTMINSIVQTMSSDLGFLKACTLCLLIGIVIFNLVYFLLYAISKIIDRTLAYPHATISANDCFFKRARLRHPVGFWFNVVSFSLSFILVVLYAIEWIVELFK